MPHKPAGRCEGLKVVMKDGRALMEFATSEESLFPMPLDRVLEKFYHLAEFSGVCPAERADAIKESVLALDTVADVRTFTQDIILR